MSLHVTIICVVIVLCLISLVTAIVISQTVETYTEDNPCKVRCDPTQGQFCPGNIRCDKDKLKCLSENSCCCPTGPPPPPPPPPPPGPVPPPPPGSKCRDQMNPDVLAEGCPAMCGPGVSCCGFDGKGGGCDPSVKNKIDCNTKYPSKDFWCPKKARPPCPTDGKNLCCKTGTEEVCNPQDKVCRNEPPQGYFSITLNLKGFDGIEDDVYLRIQRPRNPDDTSLGTEFIRFKRVGNVLTGYLFLDSSIGKIGDAKVPSEYSQKVKKGDVLHLPIRYSRSYDVGNNFFNSGRMYVSLYHPIDQLNPPPNPPAGLGEKAEPHWTTVEFTIDKLGILWANISAVDDVTMPTLKLIDNRSGAWSGYPNAFHCSKEDLTICNPNLKDKCCSLWKCVERIAKDACSVSTVGGYEATWKNIFVYREVLHKQGISHVEAALIESPKFVEALQNYFVQYFKNKWLPAIKKEGGFWADILGSVKITATDQGLQYGSHLIQPITDDQITSLWSGGMQKWPGGTSPIFVMVISAMLNSGVPPEWLCANTSQSTPVNQKFTRSCAFKAVRFSARGQVKVGGTVFSNMPMWNVYEQAMHKCGYCAYAYDYDDYLGRDGTANFPLWEGKPVCLTLSMVTDDVDPQF